MTYWSSEKLYFSYKRAEGLFGLKQEFSSPSFKQHKPQYTQNIKYWQENALKIISERAGRIRRGTGLN
jgi:hypothetical protein